MVRLLSGAVSEPAIASPAASSTSRPYGVEPSNGRSAIWQHAALDFCRAAQHEAGHARHVSFLVAAHCNLVKPRLSAAARYLGQSSSEQLRELVKPKL